MRQILAFASAIAMAALICSPVRAVAGWTSPVMVLDHSYRDPSMVVDSHGHTQIAARGPNGLWYLTNSSGTWARTRLTRDVHESGHTWYVADEHPAIAIDPMTGSLFVVFERARPDPEGSGGGGFGCRYVRLQAGSWSGPKTIPGTGCGQVVSVVVRNGVLAIAAGIVPPSSPPYVSFVTNVSGSWTSQMLTSGIEPGHYSIEPSLAIDAHGRPRIGYIREANLGADPQIWYARGTTKFGDFVKEKVADIVLADAGTGGSAPTTPDYALRTSLALTTDGSPRIAWSDADGVSYAYRSAAGWHSQVVKTGGGTDASVTLDGSGRPHIAMALDVEGLWYASRSGGAWRTVRLDGEVVRQLGGTAMAPNAHAIVVYVRGAGHFRLWYTRSTSQ